MTAAELLERVDLGALPSSARTTLQVIGPALAAGATLVEIAATLGLSRDYIASRVTELRLALEHAAERPAGT